MSRRRSSRPRGTQCPGSAAEWPHDSGVKELGVELAVFMISLQSVVHVSTKKVRHRPARARKARNGLLRYRPQPALQIPNSLLRIPPHTTVWFTELPEQHTQSSRQNLARIGTPERKSMPHKKKKLLAALSATIIDPTISRRSWRTWGSWRRTGSSSRVGSRASASAPWIVPGVVPFRHRRGLKKSLTRSVRAGRGSS